MSSIARLRRPRRQHGRQDVRESNVRENGIENGRRVCGARRALRRRGGKRQRCSGRSLQKSASDALFGRRLPGEPWRPRQRHRLKTGRKFWLDYPCDLKPGDKVVFILNIHMAQPAQSASGSEHYFPAFDYKDKYKLVIATPTAATSPSRVPGQPGVRVWVPDADDAHLANITNAVFDAFGKQNIKSFWLAGHSQVAEQPRIGSFARTSSRTRLTACSASRADGLDAPRLIRASAPRRPTVPRQTRVPRRRQ